MNVMNSPVDLRAHDDHLKHLLDQRAARADLHARFPSLSEFSDSPSLYSHPHFSPRPPDRPFLDGLPHSFRFPQSPKLYSPSLSEPRSPISDRDRLNIPHASSLDLEDDPRSSSEINTLHDADDADDDDSPQEDEEDIPPVSMYGPKMRFHSPAPWEEDEADSNIVVEEPSKRSKKKDSSKKPWGLSRGNGETRPSTDSSRSGGKSKQSLEAVSSNGVFATLAQASMSSTSLANNQSSSPQSLRDKLSLPRLRSRTPSTVGHIDTYSPSNVSPVTRIATPPHRDAYGDDHHSLLGQSSIRSETPPQHEYTHPYANPDLVRHASHDLLPPPSPSPLTFGAIRSDSNATLTDTTPSSSLSQFRSTTTLGLSPGTSTTSMNPSLNETTSPARFATKGISSPMLIDKSSLHPDTLSKLNGFQQSPVSQGQGFSPLSPIARPRDAANPVTAMGGLSTWDNGGSALKLISLEEAQAQQRSRSATANPAFTSPFASSLNTPVTEELDTQRPPLRARSSSAGGKGRAPDVVQRHGTSTPGESPINGPPRQVVKKKSGFMRLFNGKDRLSPSSPPPPVPMFATDAFAANPMPPPPPQYARPRPGLSHRVPVPSLSPSLTGEQQGSSSGSSAESPPSSSTASSASTSSGMQQQQQLSARRKVPDLSIVTSPSLVNLSVKAPFTAPLSEGPSEMTQYHLTPTVPGSRDAHPPSPSSAPPTKTDFVGLSIRPISTLFTRELKDLAVKDNNSLRTRPSLEVDNGTPTTATTAISPLSPDFPATKALVYERSSEEKSNVLGIASDDGDQSGVIQTLQEQILTARRAWQRQIWELEGQVRDLKAEVEELRAGESRSEYCAACGRGCVGRLSPDDAGNGKTLEELKKAGVKVGGVVNRPRARTGVGSRFASGT